MTQTASNYGKVLYEIGVSQEIVRETERILNLTPDLMQGLLNPTVGRKIKHNLILRIFPKEMHNFLCTLCDYQNMDQIEDILTFYQQFYNEAHQVIVAQLYYVTKPDAAETEQFKRYIKKKFHASEVELELIEKTSLLGGFIIRVGDVEIDQSLVGRMNELQQRLVWR